MITNPEDDMTIRITIEETRHTRPGMRFRAYATRSTGYAEAVMVSELGATPAEAVSAMREHFAYDRRRGTITKVATGPMVHEHRDFGVRDEKGRAVGAGIWILPMRAQGGTTQWRVYVHATRDGECFGAMNRSSYHPTHTDALAAGLRKVDASRKRYAKKYAA